jgi:energy-coupling factor transport system ATP-binding protein
MVIWHDHPLIGNSVDIRVENLSFKYDHYGSITPVLHDVSVSIRSGECLALVGPSGSGKSTLAQHLNGLLKPDSGHIWINGKPLRWTASELKALRRQVGLVFQFPESQIFEGSVFDEVAFAARQWGLPPEDIPDRVTSAMAAIGLDSAEFKERNPLKLSGGEARLISIASLLVVDPEWLVLDEPTLGLDFAHWRHIQRLILDRKASDKGVMLITHDLDLALQVCPRTLILREGRLCYDGSTEELLVKHDISEEFELASPEIVNLWKALMLWADEAVRETEFPGPDMGQLEAWILSQPAPQRQQLCSVLKQYLSNLMP